MISLWALGNPQIKHFCGYLLKYYIRFTHSPVIQISWMITSNINEEKMKGLSRPIWLTPPCILDYGSLEVFVFMLSW